MAVETLLCKAFRQGSGHICAEVGIGLRLRKGQLLKDIGRDIFGGDGGEVRLAAGEAVQNMHGYYS